MPGPSRKAGGGTRGVESHIRFPLSGGSLAGETPVSDNFLDATEMAGYHNVHTYIGVITTTFNVGGIGGGPNEPGSDTNAVEKLAQEGYTVTTADHIYTVPGSTESNTQTYFNNLSHKAPGVTYANYDSVFNSRSIPFWINGGFVLNSGDITVRTPNYPTTTGGGGWGARGGTKYSSETPTEFPVDSGTYITTYQETGGAGGPAVKTNGHAVTWAGGQGTDRVFGAIV